jgi:four helix bundle protein
MAIKSYQDLRVWQLGMDLVIESYKLTRKFPATEQFGLVNQIRRSAVSIPSNIAEGQGRHHLGDYLRFLSIANGSLKELETLMLIAARLTYVSATNVGSTLQTADQVGRMLNILQQRLRQSKSTARNSTQGS